MRLIDADVMRKDWLENGENEYVYDTNCILESIDEQPTIDAVPAIRCKDCKYAYFISRNLMYECGRLEDRLMFSDDFCSCGERRGELEESKMKTCKDCVHFLGWGDWDLCCKIKHDLCYEDTPACDDFEESNRSMEQED